MENNNDDGEAPVRRPSMLAEAEKAAERLDSLNKQLEEKLQRLEALKVEETLSGKSTVNVPQPEESPADYAEKALRGDIHGGY